MTHLIYFKHFLSRNLLAERNGKIFTILYNFSYLYGRAIDGYIFVTKFEFEFMFETNKQFDERE